MDKNMFRFTKSQQNTKIKSKIIIQNQNQMLILPLIQCQILTLFLTNVCELILSNTWCGCRGVPLLPIQLPEMAHSNFQNLVFVSTKTVNKILKLDQK